MTIPISECCKNGCENRVDITWEEYENLRDQYGDEHYVQSPKCKEHLTDHEEIVEETEIYMIVEDKENNEHN